MPNVAFGSQPPKTVGLSRLKSVIVPCLIFLVLLVLAIQLWNAYRTQRGIQRGITQREDQWVEVQERRLKNARTAALSQSRALQSENAQTETQTELQTRTESAKHEQQQTHEQQKTHEQKHKTDVAERFKMSSKDAAAARLSVSARSVQTSAHSDETGESSGENENENENQNEYETDDDIQSSDIERPPRLRAVGVGSAVPKQKPRSLFERRRGNEWMAMSAVPRPDWTPPPKILWTHWDSDAMPELISKNYARTKRMLPDWDIRLVTTTAFLKMCPFPGHGFFEQDATKKSDFIRLWLLAEHGGLYMDISVVLNESINPFYDRCIERRADFGGFFTRKHTRHAKVPAIESFFILAPPRCPLIAAWRNEYSEAMELGFLSYRRCVRKLGVELHWHSATYFAVYQALQTVLQYHMKDSPPVMYLEPTEDAMLKFMIECKLNPVCYVRTFRDKEKLESVPYFKLTKLMRPLMSTAFFDDTAN